MRSIAAWSVTLVMLASAGCEEITGGSGGGEAAWEPATRTQPPAVEPERPPERGACAPHYVKMSNGVTLEVPVECIEEGIDKGDPPPTERAMREEQVINPPEVGQHGWQK